MPLETFLARPAQANRLYWGLNLLLALLFLVLLVWPLAGLLLDQHAEIKALEIQRTAQGNLAGRVERLMAEQAELVALDGLAADYLSGDSPALAAAELQGLLSRRVNEAGGQLYSVRLLPTEDPQVAARLDAAVSHAQLRALLHALEGGRPRLVITGLELQAGEGGERLTLSLTVTGLRRRMAGGGEE
ncbi:type II secretion system protein GspM [Niveispirillum sp. KHB5.9]|uniref:type II secretion system protein GspM n=1 Tax=Niveispirillum sp. KHB5.9 TaxID=3400269 RepID=UPI003A8C7A77